ncbi:hypothetical protein [Paenibacillus sp. Soil522]|uniref:hypothetical protein n=1 Tax=Paenibacillus sp. Soil522 TaxID=1736388 RepID=UPI0006F3FC2F|nr:hypothetical protein [Paenibacillus sp. Soil522]KRE44941.1 hypothetical protein ASG81_14755 [Paenibacillus sp. Soil522]
MKNIILIGCLIGGIVAFTGEFGHVAVMTRATDSSPAKSEVSAEAVSKIITSSMPSSTVTKDTYAAEASSAEPAKPDFKLQTVNGISLSDTPSTVARKLGEPQRITEDPYLRELLIYQYPNMDVVFNGGIVYSVEIAGDSGTLLLDGVEIPATIEAVKGALGQPDYVTEDGIVFERNEALLKLFIDPETQRLTSIHYFDSFSM